MNEWPLAFIVNSKQPNNEQKRNKFKRNDKFESELVITQISSNIKPRP